MKKRLIQSIVYLLICTVYFTSCDRDTPYYGDGYDSDLNLLYSNKTITQPGNLGDLEITYSGSPIIEREVYFEMKSHSTANITLYGILPAESKAVIESVNVSQTKEGYHISGSGVSEKGTSVNVSGSIIDGKLSLDLKDVKIPSNPLTNLGKYKLLDLLFDSDIKAEKDYSDVDNPIYYVAYDNKIRRNLYFEWQYQWKYDTKDKEGKDIALKLNDNLLNLYFLTGEPIEMTLIAQVILSNIFFLLLEDITFDTDGNILATYAPLSDDLNFAMFLFQNATASMRAPTKESPVNLCYYHVENNIVYVQPNIEMILRTIQANQTKNATKATSISDLISLLSSYSQLTEWVSKGIKFHLEKVDPEIPDIWKSNYLDAGAMVYYSYANYYQDVQYKLYLTEDEIKPLLKILPLIVDIFLGDTSELMVEIPMLGNIPLGTLIDEMLEKMSETTFVRLGIFL